jgi:hypothetical protein
MATGRTSAQNQSLDRKSTGSSLRLVLCRLWRTILSHLMVSSSGEPRNNVNPPIEIKPAANIAQSRFQARLRHRYWCTNVPWDKQLDQPFYRLPIRCYPRRQEAGEQAAIRIRCQRPTGRHPHRYCWQCILGLWRWRRHRCVSDLLNQYLVKSQLSKS